MPDEVAAALLAADDLDAIVVARGTLKAVYTLAPDEAVVTVEIEPLPRWGGSREVICIDVGHPGQQDLSAGRSVWCSLRSSLRRHRSSAR